MDFSVIDFAGLAAFLTSVGSVIGALKANSNASKAKDDAAAIVSAREQTKLERDREIEKLKTEVAVLKELHKETKERLAEGTNQFKDLDAKVDTTNNLLHEILGALKNRGLEIPDRSMNGGRPF